ncbi:hypothetical protein ACFPM0_19335 [Pseudonocardia sulfidoxydans]
MSRVRRAGGACAEIVREIVPEDHRTPPAVATFARPEPVAAGRGRL